VEELKTKKGDDSFNHPTVAEFHKLQGLINKNLEEVKKQPNQNKRSIAEKEHAEEVADEIADQIHNLNLLLGALLPADVLQYALPGYRDDYRGRVSAALYVGYESSPTYKALSGCNGEVDSPEKLRLLRADYIHLVNELRKITLADYHVEIALGLLMRALTWTYFKLILVPAIVVVTFLLSSNISILQKDIAGAIALLSCCAIAGATGSLVSALLRIDAIPENLATARSLTVLRYSESIWVVPLTGFIFAILLVLILAGQVVTGPLFPTFPIPPTDFDSYFREAFTPLNVARFLGWSFIAGFAERLMPDVIDRLARKSEKLDDKPTAES
jgi:hypothetical protein